MVIIGIAVDMIHPTNTRAPHGYMYIGEMDHFGHKVDIYKRGRSNIKFWARYRS